MLDKNSKATGDRVIVEIVEEPADNVIRAGGIFIQAIENSKLIKGKIIHCGAECKRGLQAGDIVYYDKNSVYSSEGVKGSQTLGAIVITREENVIYKVE